MNDEVSVEATGETVGEAKWAALRELEALAPGIDRDAVRFQVVAEGERGLLGVGYAPARVMASGPRPLAEGPSGIRSPSPDAVLAQEIVDRVVRGIGATATTRVAEGEEGITVTIGGQDLGLLIGRHGQTLDAIQYLVNAVSVATRGREGPRVIVDASGYRARRATMLEQRARQAAQRAVATDSRVELEPMTAVERKMVHEFLKDDPEVETASEGTEPRRFVVVVPRTHAD